MDLKGVRHFLVQILKKKKKKQNLLNGIQKEVNMTVSHFQENFKYTQ